MPNVIQPLHPNDESLGPVRVKPLTEQQIKQALEDDAGADNSTGIDPTIGEGGIITSMTVKPAAEHAVDLRAQIDGVVNAGKEDASTFMVADMRQKNAGGMVSTLGEDALVTANIVAPTNPQPKPSTPQAPNLQDNVPKMIIG